MRLKPIVDMTGVMLAGGRSTRMGTDKTTLMLGGQSLLDRATRVLHQCFARTLIIRDDDQPGLGPIGGIQTALRRIETNAMFVMACDMPFADAQLIRAMGQAFNDTDAMAIHVAGRYEPLHAIYARRCLPRIDQQIAAGNLSLQQLLGSLNTQALGTAFLAAHGDWQRSLRNLNTPADWHDAQRH